MAYRAGQKLGNYQLERLLGRGGFAEVYLGKHIYLNTHAAIKVLQKQLNDEALELFLQEARTIASLKHPHIVRVLEFGIEEHHPFLVIAYAPHGTLRRLYRKGNILPPTLIMPYVRQIADALYYAHERKIIHRDVKPENMLVDDDNTVLLSDFGLAMKELSTYHSVQSTDCAGTTTYISPEQLRGKPCAASDQYSLGIVMYEWLCGCVPFDGPDISVVVQHLHERPQPLREHVATLPVEIEGIVLKALAKDPKQRFASVQDLATAFEEACKNIPLAEPATAISHANISQYNNLEPGKLLQAEHSGKLIEVVTDSVQSTMASGESAMPVISRPSAYLSLQARSLSATLDLGATTQDETVSTITSQKKAPLSRRTMLAGLVGIVALAGGASIWHFSSGGTGTASLQVQKGLRSSASVPSSSVTTNQSSTTHPTGKDGTKRASGSPAVDRSGTGESGRTTNSSTSSTPSISSTPPTSGTGATATTQPSGNAGSSSTATPTPPKNAPLTIQIDNPPASVQNGTTTYISINTNIGGISFQFNAFYSGLKNKKKTSSESINGTTDGSGVGHVSWTPSLPSGQVVSGTNAAVHVVATDQSGNQVTSQISTVQILR